MTSTRRPPKKRMCGCGNKAIVRGYCRECITNKRIPEMLNGIDGESKGPEPDREHLIILRKELSLYRYSLTRTDDELEATKRENLGKWHQKKVCAVLKEHADDLRDDPDRLSTKFIQSLINTRWPSTPLVEQ